MRIAFLAKRQSIHTVRWVNALADRGNDVHLISSVEVGEELHDSVHFHPLPFRPPAGFFLNRRPLQRLLRTIKPEVLNTHFASGYGTLARLSGFHPNVLSVWGSDVYAFPSKSPLHAWLVRENLKLADWVCSTSADMARQARTIFPHQRVSVVPFGIDTSLFSPLPSTRPSDVITIGTVKALDQRYGIDVLLRAFAELRRRVAQEHPDLAGSLRLLIVGGGPEADSLRGLARELGIDGVTRFAGPVPHEEVPLYLHQMEIYVALSRLESFGVAVLEASACALPVVVSDVGGLPEVVVDGRTGIVVPGDDATAASVALVSLVTDASLRNKMGLAGRLHVEQEYSWDSSVERMEAVYKQTIDYAT